MSSDNRRRRQAGFTLTELLVATVLMGLFVIILFNFMNAQSRFTGVQNARQEVDENVRGSLELMSSELRAVPGGAITTAGSSVLTVRVPRVWGVYCGTSGGRAHVVFPTGVSANADVFPADIKVDGSWGLAVVDPNNGTPPRFMTASIRDSLPQTTGLCVTALGTNFSTNPAPIAKSFLLGATLARSDGTTANPPARGADAFLYQTVSYTTGTSTQPAGSWLYRSYGSDGTNPQQLAGPLQPGSNAVRFRYLCNGTYFTPATEADRAKVTAVEIAVSMQSRPETRTILQTQSDTIVVHLRNSGRVAVC